MRLLTVILGCLPVAAACPAQTPIWTHTKPSTSPSARRGHAMAYDSARQRTVLFGGILTGGKVNLADTWEWDGRNWTQIKPTSSPSARNTCAMAYDSVRQRTVLFGGWNSSKNFADTWEWDGTSWKKMNPGSSPSARLGCTIAYDSARQRTVLFGGLDSAGRRRDTWEWNGTSWAQTKPASSPSPRLLAGCAYDSVRQRTVLFGGEVGRNSLYSAETWEYGIARLTLTANTPTISIANGGTQTLTLNAGANLKNKSYWTFGSTTGTMPGIVLTGIHIPLVPDFYTSIALGAVNTTVFTKFMGPLSATGTATASLNVPANVGIPRGFKLYHAYVVYDGTTGQVFTSSNPVSVEFK